MVINLRFFLIGNSSDLTPTSVKLEKLSAQTHDVSFFFFFWPYAIYPFAKPFEEVLVKTRPVIVIHIQEFVIDRC